MNVSPNAKLTFLDFAGLIEMRRATELAAMATVGAVGPADTHGQADWLEPEPGPELESEPEPEQQREPEPEPEPEQQPEPVLVVESELESELECEPEPDPKQQPEPESQSDSKPKSFRRSRDEKRRGNVEAVNVKALSRRRRNSLEHDEDGKSILYISLYCM